jgi:hypothetical protein
VLPDLITPLTRENGSFYLQYPGTPLIRVTANAWIRFSKERLRGEFIVRAYRFAPTTGSLESPQQLLLLINAFFL